MTSDRDYNLEAADPTERKYAYRFDFDVMHPYMLQSFEPHFVSGRLLELASFRGDFTERLLLHFGDVTCVEASSEAIAVATRRFGERVTYVNYYLFRFLRCSITKTCEHLGISPEIRVSSDIAIDCDLKNQDKVLALCEAVGANTYVNAIGGMDLYSKETCWEKGIELKFIKSKPFEYPQFGDAFVPWLSIIDVMMFNPLDTIRTCIATNYELI